jgi:excisionase family DNA binding protein/PAS domain S-box-containing protein
MGIEKAEQQFLTVKEVAAYLQVNQTTIYRRVRRSEIPAFKVGGDWRFDTARVDAWRLAAKAPRPRNHKDRQASAAQPSTVARSDRGARPPDDSVAMSVQLARLCETIGAMVAPLAELQALIPVIKQIAQSIDDKRDASDDIAHLFEGRAVPFPVPAERLFEFAPLPFAATDRERKLVSFNDAYCRLFGFSPKHLRTVAVTDLVEESDLARFAALNRQMISGELKSAEFVGKRITAHGPPILVSSRGWAVYLKPAPEPDYLAVFTQRIATEDEASGVFARCAEGLSKRRATLLSRR